MAKTIKLSKPLKINQQDVNEVVLDFNKITGATLLAAEREARTRGEDGMSVFVSMQYQAIVAAKIIGVPVEDIEELPGNDFKNIVLSVANFLLTPA